MQRTTKSYIYEVLHQTILKSLRFFQKSQLLTVVPQKTTTFFVLCFNENLQYCPPYLHT